MWDVQLVLSSVMDFLGLGSGHFVALRFAHLQHAFSVRRFGIFARCIRCSMSHPFLRRARKSLECVFFLTLPGCAFSSLARSFISFFLLWTCCGFGHDLLGFSYVTARPLELVLRAAIYPFRRPFGSCFSGFFLLGGDGFVYFDSMPDQSPVSSFLALH